MLARNCKSAEGEAEEVSDELKIFEKLVIVRYGNLPGRFDTGLKADIAQQYNTYLLT